MLLGTHVDAAKIEIFEKEKSLFTEHVSSYSSEVDLPRLDRTVQTLVNFFLLPTLYLGALSWMF